MEKRVRDRADGEGTRKKTETEKRAQKKTKIAARETAAAGAVEGFLVCPRRCNFMRTGKQ